MTTGSFLCVFLLNCFSNPLTPLNIPECPINCECYVAPKEGIFDDIAISLICDGKSDSNRLSLLKDKSINTLKFSGIDFNLLPNRYLEGLSVNNLVFTDSAINENTRKDPQNGIHIFSGLNTDSLQVITFIDVKLQIGLSQFAWIVFESFKNLRVIHIEGGYLETIGSNFKKIPAQNLLTLTLYNTQLRSIEKNVFSDWKSLRMLTINRNLIKDWDWMPSDMPDLWYLDLRFNKLETIPEGLDKSFPTLRVLKLGNNEIRVMPHSVIKPLFSMKHLEFSFYKKNEGKEDRNNYFYANNEMKWIVDYYKNDEPSPLFFYQSLRLTELQQWLSNIKDTTSFPWSYDLKDESDFNYENTGHLNIVQIPFKPGYSLSFRNNPVFLSGVNIAYINADRGFGDGNYYKIKTEMEDRLKEIADNGGNSVRIFLHGNGENFKDKYFDDSNHFSGFMTTSLIQELKEFLDAAQQKNIFVIICLWSGDISNTRIFLDENYLKSYLDNVLKPMAYDLSSHQALGAWDIMDEPEKLVESGIPNSVPCFDTTNFKFSSAVGPGPKLPMEKILRFIGLHLSTLRSTTKRLVTVGVSEEVISFRSCTGCPNYFTDKCFQEASGESTAILDFYQIHLKIDGSSMIEELPDKIDKPILIGKFITGTSGKSACKDFSDAYFESYSGILGWPYNEDPSVSAKNERETINQCMENMKNELFYPDEIKITID